MNKIKSVLDVCRINEVLLAIPFAGTASCWASSQIPDIMRMLLVMLAAASGYFIGNVVNAYADRDIDGKNPRTSKRPMVTGAITGRDIIYIIVINAAVVLISTALINPFYILLLPVPFVICVSYSFCKRFTWGGHFVVAVAHAVCPVGAWLVFGQWNDWRAILAGAIVFFLDV